jgi:hypothetical protein
MNEPICPVCNNPVDTNTEAHVIGSDGAVYHAQCYDAHSDTTSVPSE